ncbi:LuxR C-terminal-related transcriptional regulator [Sphingobacterium spiritivorum]|nr:LuxR C-terminal-related transcriptional regulator [Sphingobacterium spiritivorum]SUJ00752.1 Response regulator protein vraR [Sphingobacterium spiritivorum]
MKDMYLFSCRFPYCIIIISMVLSLLMVHTQLNASVLETEAPPSVIQEIQSLKFGSVLNRDKTQYADGADGQSWWIKGVLTGEQLHKELILQIPSPHFRDASLYVYSHGKLVLLTDSDHAAKAESFARYNQFHFMTDQPVYYIKSNSTMYKGIHVVVKEESAFFRHEATQLFGIGLYYGLAVMSVIFNFVFYLIFKDRRFITYCLFQLIVFAEFFYEDGMFYFLSEGKLILEHFVVYSVPFSSSLACLFAYYFLDLRNNFRNYWKVVIPLMTLSFVGLILFIIFEWKGFISVVNISSFAATLFAIALAIKQFRKDVYARFLVLTFGVILLVGIGFVLNTNFNQSWLSVFNMDTLRLVSAFEIISISFAIVFKARALQEENERCRNEINSYLNQLNELKDNLPVAKETVVLKENTIVFLKENYQLTEREMDVLMGLWEGLSNQELGEKLFISLNTVKYHVSNLYIKLDIKSRTQALKFKEKIGGLT